MHHVLLGGEAAGAIHAHLVVIAAHGMEPGLIEQRQHLQRLRAAIHQVAGGEDAIHPVVEAGLVQQVLKQRGLAVDVTHQQVAAAVIASKGGEQPAGGQVEIGDGHDDAVLGCRRLQGGQGCTMWLTCLGVTVMTVCRAMTAAE
ncbi:hypothetical protein D3C78_1202420 [compost metagenome]